MERGEGSNFIVEKLDKHYFSWVIKVHINNDKHVDSMWTRSHMKENGILSLPYFPSTGHNPNQIIKGEMDNSQVRDRLQNV